MFIITTIDKGKVAFNIHEIEKIIQGEDCCRVFMKRTSHVDKEISGKRIIQESYICHESFNSIMAKIVTVI